MANMTFSNDVLDISHLANQVHPDLSFAVAINPAEQFSDSE
jgi:hypothetical protein